MADTNINAYFMEVDEKLQAVLRAQSEYEAAKDRLEEKKKQVNWVDPTEEPEQPAEEDASENEEEKDKKTGIFKKK